MDRHTRGPGTPAGSQRGKEGQAHPQAVAGALPGKLVRPANPGLRRGTDAQLGSALNRRWRRYRAMPFAAVEEARLGELFGDDEEVLSFDL